MPIHFKNHKGHNILTLNLFQCRWDEKINKKCQDQDRLSPTAELHYLGDPAHTARGDGTHAGRIVVILWELASVKTAAFQEQAAHLSGKQANHWNPHPAWNVGSYRVLANDGGQRVPGWLWTPGDYSLNLRIKKVKTWATVHGTFLCLCLLI